MTQIFIPKHQGKCTAQKIAFKNRDVTFSELAREHQIGVETLRSRYDRGLRDDDLVRPIADRLNRNADARSHSARICEEQATERREKQASEAAQQNAKRRRREEAMRRAKEEHARAFSQPLISDDLLSPTDRRKNLERVHHCGQRSWASNGAAS